MKEEKEEQEEKHPEEVEELRKKAEEFDELLERHKRLMAEFINYKSRTEKERSIAVLNARKETLLALLPLVDDLLRALDAAQDCEDIQSLQEGLMLAKQRLQKTLESLGVEEIEALGLPFDPRYHEAVATSEQNGVDSERIVEVFEKGYLLKDGEEKEVLRPAKVVVAKPKSKK